MLAPFGFLWMIDKDEFSHIIYLFINLFFQNEQFYSTCETHTHHKKLGIKVQTNVWKTSWHTVSKRRLHDLFQKDKPFFIRCNATYSMKREARLSKSQESKRDNSLLNIDKWALFKTETTKFGLTILFNKPKLHTDFKRLIFTICFQWNSWAIINT